MAGGYAFDEASVRRIVQSVLYTERNRRNSPVPNYPRDLRKGEDFRLIRGQSTGLQSGSAVTIDNVVVLSGGLDPSRGSAGIQVTIANTINPRSLGTADVVRAVYSPRAGSGTVDWEILPGDGDKFLSEFITIVGSGESIEATGTESDGVGGKILPIYLIQQDLVTGVASLNDITTEVVEYLRQFFDATLVPTLCNPPVVFNTFSHPAGGGQYPIEFLGFFSGPMLPGTAEWSTPVFTLTGFDVKGHGAWSNLLTQFLAHQPGNPPVWVELDSFGNITFPPFDPSGIQNQIDNLPDTEGYCIDIGLNTIHFDAITADAGIPATGRNLGEQQFFVHYSGAAAKTDAQWKTALDYDPDALCQWVVNFEGVWQWATLEDYSTLQNQFPFNFEGDWRWKETQAYDTNKRQYLENNLGTWRWLNRNTLLTPGTGETDGIVTVNSVSAVSLAIDTNGIATVTINYDKYKVFGIADGSSSFTGTADIWDTTGTSVVTNVACVDGSIVVTTENLNLLIKP